MPLTKSVKIKIKNPVWSEAKDGINIINTVLSYTSKFVVQKQYGKDVREYKKSFVTGKMFYTGFVPLIKRYCELNKIEIEIEDLTTELKLIPDKIPTIEGVVFGEGKFAFQKEMIDNCLKHQRGVIKSATGTGKTVMMMGLMSCFPESKILFVSDSLTPISNFKKACKDFNFKHNYLTLSTIQGIHKKDVDFDIIIIDECHAGMNSPEGMYQKFLTKSLAPIRIGFTGTLPETEVGKLLLEGLVGPVIGEYTIQDGHKDGVLTKPKIILKMLPKNSEVGKLSLYSDIYKRGVVNNRALNLQIVEDLKKCVDNKESSLILVTEIEHGNNILKMAKNIYGLNLIFASGSTEIEMREQIIKYLEDKTVDAVIGTAIFKKSMNVPNLDNVFLAFGGKASSSLLQSIGRGLRSSKGKEYTKIYDYFNPSNKVLINHFGHRLCIYFEEGWIGE